MPGPYLHARLDLLRRSQNGDGGWGYFPGKASWLEPTAYAALALHGEPAADRAWALLQSWQSPDGSWRPSSAVKEASWATSLCATIAMARNEWGAPLEKGVAWLVGSVGAEATWFNVVVSRLGLVDRIATSASAPGPGSRAIPAGWSPPRTLWWRSSWLRPSFRASSFRNRAWPTASPPGEAELLNVRSRDGGWNYGESSVRGSRAAVLSRNDGSSAARSPGPAQFGQGLRSGAAGNRPNAVALGPRLADHRHAASRHHAS